MFRRISMMDVPRASAVSGSRRNKCNAKRNAVFSPIPGSFDNSATALSSNIELYVVSNVPDNYIA